MGHVSMQALLRHAQEGKYAVGYFESWNLESAYAVVRAAEATRSPVIIGCCGEYVEFRDRKHAEHVAVHAALVKAIAERATVPVATLLNEADRVDTVYRGIGAGFDMVMFADHHMPVSQLEPITRDIVKVARPCGIAVEAEVGALPMVHKESGKLESGANTDPDEAAGFAERTGVDALAVAIGNIHLLEGRKAELDFGLLERIAAKVKVPLVLHGGTGIDRAAFKEATRLGVAKVNVGALLKRVVIEAERRFFAETDVASMNPNDVLGKGGPRDLGARGQDAIIEAVVPYIRAFGGENKAY